MRQVEVFLAGTEGHQRRLLQLLMVLRVLGVAGYHLTLATFAS